MGTKPTSKNRIPFTDEMLSSLPVPPPKRRAYYWNDAGRFLCLLVSSRGVKTFFYYRYFRGKPLRRWIGQWPAVSIEQARLTALAMSCYIDSGSEPPLEIPATGELAPPITRANLQSPTSAYVEDILTSPDKGSPTNITLVQLFRSYIQDYARSHCKTWQDIIETFKRDLDHWRDRELGSLRGAEIRAWHSSLGTEKSKITANRALGLLKTIYNRAIEWDLFTGSNPAIKIRRFSEKSRARFLDSDELPQFLAAVDEHATPKVRDFLKMCLITAQRFTNVAEMRWDQLNLERAIWNIPETKNGTWHIVPLPPEAIEILQERKEHSDSEWVFPSRYIGGTHLKRPYRYWSEILKTAGINNLRIHDLRRTNAAWQAAAGASLLVIGKSLNHKNPSATAIYARLNVEPVRKSMNTAVRNMFGSGKKQTDCLLEHKEAELSSESVRYECNRFVMTAKTNGLLFEGAIRNVVESWLQDVIETSERLA